MAPPPNHPDESSNMMTTSSDDSQILVDLQRDGTGQLVVDGQRRPIKAASLAEAREVALRQVQRIADERGAEVRFLTTDPDGAWSLLMNPHGEVSEDVSEGTRTTHRPFPPAVSDETPSATRTDTSGTYDSSYVLDVIMPATRTPRATHGWRSMLGLGPSKSELAERADRAAICTPFGRPVTIVVADPRGGSGKTTCSLLLAGAFGTARGGGVLALENHELRGTMHLRTDASGSSSTIRALLAAQQHDEIAADTVRLGDLGRFVRHQVSGQYDVLVSATKKGRALRGDEFDKVHELVSRMYWVIIVDTANNESAENWQAAIAKADALLVPVKWRNDYSLPAIEMLEELETSGPVGADLVARAVVVASHGQGDSDPRCRAQLKPYFEARTQAVIEIPPDPHIAEGNAIQHEQLTPVTRRQSMRMAAEVAKAISTRGMGAAGN
jgi:cellulose biosynthesis protein BcsQ